MRTRIASLLHRLADRIAAEPPMRFVTHTGDGPPAIRTERDGVSNVEFLPPTAFSRKRRAGK